MKCGFCSFGENVFPFIFFLTPVHAPFCSCPPPPSYLVSTSSCVLDFYPYPSALFYNFLAPFTSNVLHNLFSSPFISSIYSNFPLCYVFLFAGVLYLFLPKCLFPRTTKFPTPLIGQSIMCFHASKSSPPQNTKEDNVKSFSCAFFFSCIQQECPLLVHESWAHAIISLQSRLGK